MRKLILIGGITSLILVGYAGYETFIGKRCTGSKNCDACKTCNYCKNCNEGKGSCGVCK